MNLFRSHNSSRTDTARRWIHGGIGACIALCTSLTATAAPSEAYSVADSKWGTTYLTYIAERGFDPGNVEFHMPAIWLFSPSGALVRQVTAQVGNDPRLEAFKASYPFDASAKALPGTLSLKQMRELLAKTTGVEPPMPSEGAWYAVLFLMDSPACKSCPTFDEGLGEIEKKADGKLTVVRLTTTP